MLNVYELQDANKRRSGILLVAFVVFVGIIAWFLAKVFNYGISTVGIALILAGLMSFASFWWGDKIILTISGAHPASRDKEFNFFTVVENLALASQIPMPKLYILDDSSPNAFAAGRDPQHAIICATSGLLNKLERTELEGVVSHELSHIRNYDTRLMAIVCILVGMITLLGDWFLRGLRFGGRSRDDKGNNLDALLFIIGILLVVLSPLIAQLIQLALFRRREFLADSSGAMLTRYPEGLARALEKIDADKEPLEAANKATAHLYIANPLKNIRGQMGWFASLFNTHPPIKERIKLLREMQ